MVATMCCLAAVTLGIDVGWEPTPDGKGVQYIIQLSPEQLQSLREGTVVHSDIPAELRGVRSYRIQVGTGQLPKQGLPPAAPETPAAPPEPGPSSTIPKASSPSSTPAVPKHAESPPALETSKPPAAPVDPRQSLAPAWPTPAPVSPSPASPAPIAPVPIVAAPKTPVPVAPAPTTPVPVSQVPTTPVPLASAPDTLRPGATSGSKALDHAKIEEKQAVFRQPVGVSSGSTSGSPSTPTADAASAERYFAPLLIVSGTAVALLASLLYLGWLHLGARAQYRSLLARQAALGRSFDSVLATGGSLDGYIVPHD